MPSEHLLEFVSAVRTLASDDPDGVRSELDKILAERQFIYNRSLISRIMEWIGRQLERLLEMLNIPAPAAVSGGGLGSVIVAAVIVAVIIAVLFVVFRAFRKRRSRKREEPEDPSIAVEIKPNDEGLDWTDDALGNFDPEALKVSILRRYRHLVDELADRQLVGTTPGLTGRELVNDLGETRPVAQSLFAEATSIFEGPWYADESGTRAQLSRLEDIEQSILQDEHEMVSK